MDACTLKQEYSQILIAMPTGEGMCILSRLCLESLGSRQEDQQRQVDNIYSFL